MRKAKKEEILNMLNLLHKVHEKVKDIAYVDFENMEGVIVDCQSSAIQIGMEIEKSEGEGTRTVKYLEDYCECLYQCIQPEHSHDGQDLYDELESCFISVQNCFIEEIQVRKEVVFLPYHASMWDSMESVWKAAAADEQCDAYVVPIPFYEKSTDGTFKKFCYEGNLLPQSVPVVSWTDYDLTERMPDVIFIHNPYDDGNIVTSVHPAFYASELKKYTPKLIYIPYYLNVNDVVGENAVISKGVFYADYVIVQSQRCCKEYIQIYNLYRKAYKLQDAFKDGEEKFLPLGSPILDSMYGEVDWETVPEDWKNKIWLGNHKKKVIFYNTHLSDVMHVNADRFFKKIQDVLNIFKSQDDVVLLWRPHPLTWQTIQAMNPAAAQRYQCLVDGYKAQGWGIYDDTSDLKRSVKLSDAYYGDWSSVVAMFQEVGKPVMMQDLNILEE